MHLIVQQAAGVGWPVAATIDSKAHDEIDIERFVPIFDAVLETRLTDAGEQEFRVRGPTQSECGPFDIFIGVHAEEDVTNRPQIRS